MKKLFEVNIKFYAYAENETEATAIADSSEFDVGGCDVESYEVDIVEQHWLSAIPFGETEDRTCKEILDNIT